ncbi:MAG: ERCC4 domain-containing protein [Clostridia bacterium]|nr:ERCC4 domain-containing protein [Clostridia bacterium]
MKDKIIIVDTREKGHKKILEYFDSVGQDYIISKLDAGDYALFKDFSTIIDKKDGLLELSHNLCNSLEHERIKREIQRAKDLGCKNFIFLIQDSKIKTIQDIKSWSSPHTKVKGETLLKIMNTMCKKYAIRFIIVPKKKMGEMIIKLLEVDYEKE